MALFLLSACGSRSYEDFREEGESITRSLIKELREIRTREDLLSTAPKLEKLFLKLAEVMIQARHFQQMNPHQSTPALSAKDHALSDQLRTELNRVYRMEGGREVIEKCQEKALKKMKDEG